MAPSCVIAPSPLSDWSEVDSPEIELARQVQGRVYRKHILSRGTLIHPLTGTKISIDDNFVSQLQRNFDNNVCDIVQVPLANDKNEHVENPGANKGEVVGIEYDKSSGKVYALVDAREDAEKFGKTYLGASAMLHMNYKDSKTNQRVGPTLLHVAVTNRPYVTGLDPYEPVVAASAELDGKPALVLSGQSDREGHMPRSLDEVLAELRTDHQIDVSDLQTQLSASTTKAEEAETRATAAEARLSADASLADRVVAALKGTEEATKLSANDITSEDLVNAVAELANRNVTLSTEQEAALSRIAALEKRNTESEIDRLIGDGFILPAKREVYLTMALTNREMFDQIIPDEPVIKLNAESGSSPRPGEHQRRDRDVADVVDVEAELARLTGPGGPAAQYITSA